MKTIKKAISWLILSAMLISVICVAPFNVFAAATYNVSTPGQLESAVSAINTNGVEAVISLSDDISVNAGCTFTNSSADVTFIGNGHILSATNTVISINNGATVTLGDGQSELTLTCGDNNDDPGIVHVWGKDSVCNMYDKVTLKDHKGNNYLGGGVTVESGTFIMNGGTIQNCGIDGGSVCYGGGVAVYSGGIFNMNGGVISNCYALSDETDAKDPNRCFTGQGGGVFVTGGSSFTMNGGTITKCRATNFGGGISEDISYDELSSGWGYIKSSVTINNGTISSNTADCGAGVFTSGYFYWNSEAIGAITPVSGITSNPGLYINGGEISSNIAKYSGGGVFVVALRSTIKAQIHNAVISNNKADSGAGIESQLNWTQLDIDGCTITDNTSTTQGGGIAVFGNTSGFTSIKNTVITDNTSGDRGAGVYYDANSQLKISGKNIIKDNTFNGKKNNLNILSSSKPVYVIGDLEGSEIGLSDPTLWDDNMEDTANNAVSTEYLTSGYKTNNTVIPAYAFTSDHQSWYVDYSDVKPNEVRLVRYEKDVNYHINNEDMDSI